MARGKLALHKFAVAIVSAFSLLASMNPYGVLGAAKTYDIDILLFEPHPFSRENLTTSVEPRSALSEVTSLPNGKPSRDQVFNAVTIFGGVMTDNVWEDIFTPSELEFRDSTMIGLAAYKKIWHPIDLVSVGVEGQLVRHFGDQDLWEFNLPLVFRWHVFPWDKWLDTSFTFGIGPSYASEVPGEEAAQDGDSHQWLVHWFGELEFGPPGSLWSGVFRLHHRSGAFGLVADEGGSNVLTIGIRRWF